MPAARRSSPANLSAVFFHNMVLKITPAFSVLLKKNTGSHRKNTGSSTGWSEPNHKDDSIRLLHWIHQHFPEHSYLVSLLSQYTPYTKNPDYPQLNRRITSYEYNKVVDTALELGMTDGFMQQKSSAKEEYTPPFNLEGLWSFLPLHLKHLKIHDNISDRSLTDLRSYVPLALSQQNKTDIEIFD